MCKLILILIEPGGGVRFGQEVPSMEGLTGQMKVCYQEGGGYYKKECGFYCNNLQCMQRKA